MERRRAQSLESARFKRIPHWRHTRGNSPSFTLNRLDKEPSDDIPVFLQISFEVFRVVVPDQTLFPNRSETGYKAARETLSACQSSVHTHDHRRAPTHGPNPVLLSGSVLKLMAPKLLPWKLPSTLTTLAIPSLIPFFIYPHFLANLMAVSTASTPVFIGRTMSYPNILVILAA